MPCHDTTLNRETSKPLLLDSEEVSALLPKLDTFNIMKSLFLSLNKGTAVQPSQTLTPFPEASGDFITYLGAMYDEKVFGAKLSPYIVTDTQPIVTAWTNLMSMTSGQPLLWCDSSQLTVERTAGTTALAIDYLANKESEHLAVIGSGKVAFAHLKHALTLREWKKVTIYSLSLKDDKQQQSAIMSIDDRIEIADSAQQCVQEADVVMLCTSSALPVINIQDVKS